MEAGKFLRRYRAMLMSVGSTFSDEVAAALKVRPSAVADRVEQLQQDLRIVNHAGWPSPPNGWCVKLVVAEAISSLPFSLSYIAV